ncbi:MAG: amino acid permease, partial [bacterium]
MSYAGFNAGIYVAAETRDPERTVPRSLWLGTILVTVLYLLLNLVFVTALPATEIVGRKEVAAIAAEAIGGASLRTLMSLVVCLGTLSSVAGMLMTGPRVFSRMADDGLFPGWFRSGPSAVQR